MSRYPRFASHVRTLVACSSLALAGCSHDHAPAAAAATADVIVTATAIPADGKCAHIVVTRLADFQSTEYRGLLAGANLKALVGEDRVTATAYPTPCTSEPPTAPWTADAQTVTLTSGSNTVSLKFHQTGDVNIDPAFRTFDAGLAFAGGLEYRRYLFELRYTQGLTDAATDAYAHTDSVKNRTIAIAAGIRFK